MGNWTPAKAFFASVVGLPNLSKATPGGIFFPVFAATLIFPLLITETEVSKIKGIKEILYPGQNKFSRYKKNLKKEINIPANIAEDLKILNA